MSNNMHKTMKLDWSKIELLDCWIGINLKLIVAIHNIAMDDIGLHNNNF